jgi:hypothetical protein
MSTLRALLVLCALVSAISSCAPAFRLAARLEPLQNGGVVVRPGAEARLDVMCRYRGNDAQQVCAGPEEE